NVIIIVMNQAPAPAPAPKRPDGPQGPRPNGPRPERSDRRGGRGGNRSRSGSARGGSGRPGAATRRIQRMLRRPTMSRTAPKAADYYPEPAGPSTVRIIPLGGAEEVGRNMLAVEIGATGDIIVFDAG